MYTKFGLILLIGYQDMNKNQILTSITGRNSVAILGKNEDLQFTNVDIVNDNVHTKLGLNLSIRSQDI